MIRSMTGWLQSEVLSFYPLVMKTKWNQISLLFLMSVLLVPEGFVGAQDPVADPANDVLLDQLKAGNMKALRSLQTSFDPRIPEALLPLLNRDLGSSEQRLAARGIGSRYGQIPTDRIPVFVAALKRTIEQCDGRTAIRNMANRAIGLLTRKYGSAMFSPSPDGKWVIYERRGLPCLIDLERSNEELLGWDAENSGGQFSPAWDNEEVKESAQWESRGRAVASGIIVGRKSSSIWIWKVKDSSLLKLTPEILAKAASMDPKTLRFYRGSCASSTGWEGNTFRFDATLSVPDPDGKPDDRRYLGSWNLETGSLNLTFATSIEPR